MYFPVSGVHTSPIVPLVVGFALSFIGTPGGISGAVLILPFQVSILGFTSPAASPTNLIFNIAATPGGIFSYIRQGRMLWPLVLILSIGSIPGAFLGGLIRIFLLPDARNFKLFAGLVLLYIAFRLFQSIMRGTAKEERAAEETAAPGPCEIGNIRLEGSRIGYEFLGKRFSLSIAKVFLLSLSVGLIGGAYGIGGSALIAPILVSIFCLPVHTISGATLASNFLTSLSGCLFYCLFSYWFRDLHYSVKPDMALGILFGLGGLAGTYMGARLQNRLPSRVIKIILMSIMSALSIIYIAGLTP
jgi:uncharacterized protein